MHTLRRTIFWILATGAWACAGSVTGVDRGPGGDVATIAIDPSSLTLVAGTEAPLHATARDQSGHTVADVSVVWSVKDTSVAYVTSNGVVSARNIGNTQIAASAGGVSAIATVAVQPPPVSSVLVQPLSQALVLGQGATFTATPRDVNGSPLAGRVITWSSSNDSVATVSQTGDVATRAVGTATITATSEGASGSATVTVSPVPVASIEAQPATATLVVGATVALTAQVKDANGALLDRAVSWSSDAPSVATVSPTGVVTAVAPGSATITVQAEGRSATAAITVNRAPVAAVAVTPSSVSVAVGSKVTLAATATVADGSAVTDRVITWTSSDLGIAVVSTTGEVTGVAPGSATITATTEGKSGASTVTVVRPAVSSVVVQPQSASLPLGASTTLTATVTDVTGAIATGASVTWASSNTAVATVSPAGVVTATGLGSAAISATSGGKSGSAAITVVAVPVGTVAVTPSAATLVPSQVVPLTAVVRDANDKVVTDRVVTWTSGNPAVATVDANGVVTAVAPGVAVVTAVSEGKSATSSITVVRMPVGSVAVNPATASIMTGQMLALTATVRDTSGTVVTDRTVTWASSNTAIATVSGSGVVTAVSPGTATITATSEGKSGSAFVAVTAVPVATVILQPTSVTITPNQTVTLVATTMAGDGSVLTGRLVTFASGDPNVASVSASGVVTGVAPGSTSVVATSEGKSDTSTVTVKSAVANVIVSPSMVFVRRNNTVQLSVTAYDAAGHVIVGRPVTWSSDDGHTATVSATGLVSAQHAGTATITATIDGQSGSTQVTVTN